MKELRILLASICLVYIAALSVSVSASSEREDEGERRGGHTIGHTAEREDENDEHRKISSSERLKELRSKQKKTKKVNIPHRTATGSTTQSGTTTKTNTATTAASAVTKSATINYRTPEGTVPVGFSVTVKGGVITAASSTKKAGGTSGYYQDSFATSLGSAVVGKKIAGLQLRAIGGASLTTNAFTQFVASSF